MFFISPQIFQIEYSENMNEMEVVWGPDTYGMWPWSAGMETTRIDTNIWGPLVQDEQLVVQVHVQWSSCILFPSFLAIRLFTFWRQPLSVQLPVWHLVPSPWPHQVAFASGLPQVGGDQQQGLHYRRLFRQSTQGPWGWLQRWEKGLTWLHPYLSTPDNLFALDLACLRKWWTETSFMYSWLLYGHSQLPVLVLLSLEIGHTKNELFRNSVLIPKAGGSWKSWWQ